MKISLSKEATGTIRVPLKIAVNGGTVGGSKDLHPI